MSDSETVTAFLETIKMEGYAVQETWCGPE